ncbi:hypothetical protein BC629DRAFT_1726671 [Irpex lacteus]|nr:hypothetical protein BC629DRAFT_1726671 [Irpex lacteus]
MMMPVRDRDDAAYLSDSTAAEEEYDSGAHYAPDNTIPIVQRESSLTRLQEAFADHGLSAGSTRPVTELNLPQQQSTPIFQSAPVSLSGGPGPSTMAYSLSQSGMHDPYGHHARSSPHHGVLPPVGQVYGNATAELRNVYPEQHLPTLVPNMATANNEYAYTKVGFGSEYDSEYGTGYEDGYERGYEPERSQLGIGIVTIGSLGDSDDQEYPPCVVVVERGRHGKKDTYYVIPGGAPVIFEDAKGNEVGDFTGRYRPRRQRPVIIEDSHGREIGRLGFDDESSLDYPYRHASSNSSGSKEDSTTGEVGRRQRSYRDDGHVSSSRHSSKHPSGKREGTRLLEGDLPRPILARMSCTFRTHPVLHVRQAATQENPPDPALAYANANTATVTTHRIRTNQALAAGHGLATPMPPVPHPLSKSSISTIITLEQERSFQQVIGQEIP